MQHGLSSPESFKCFKAQQSWLAMEPAAPDPFPAHLRKLMHALDVEDPAAENRPALGNETSANALEHEMWSTIRV